MVKTSMDILQGTWDMASIPTCWLQFSSNINYNCHIIYNNHKNWQKVIYVNNNCHIIRIFSVDKFDFSCSECYLKTNFLLIK